MISRGDDPPVLACGQQRGRLSCVVNSFLENPG
jgi:hypothetical protein